MIDHLDVKNPEIDCWVVNGKEQREEGETLWKVKSQQTVFA